MMLRHLMDMTRGHILPGAPAERYAYNDYEAELLQFTLLERLYGILETSLIQAEQLFSAQNRLGILQFEDRASFPMFTECHGRPRLKSVDVGFRAIRSPDVEAGALGKSEGMLRSDRVARIFQVSVRADIPSTAGGDPDDYSEHSIE